VRDKGFVYMDTPGYDPGRGDRPSRGRREPHLLHHRPRLCLRGQPAPSIKLATNSDIFRRMEDDMDIDCGDILEGIRSSRRARRSLPKCWRWRPASTPSRRNLGYGDLEFVPWQIGAVM
jgi:altronate hydrolase